MAFFAVLILAVCALYGQGLNNQLFFDDARLTDGTIFGNYGSLLQLKVRMLSYGSFVWLQDLVGEGWWKQRLFNLVLHLGTSAGIYALLSSLLDRTVFPQELRNVPQFAASKAAALRLGVGLFALNPVAVYAVAYLVQRSILMATFWTVLACLFFVWGLVQHRRRWFGFTALAYLLAVLSKEAAIMGVALLVPLYVFVSRPSRKQSLILAGGSLAVLIAITAVLLSTSFYANVIGNLTDEVSNAYAGQLEQIKPGIRASLYPLSMLNQAAQFFHYGLLWLLPNPAWLSIDIRPEYPLSLMAWPQAAGALAYVMLLIGAAWLVMRRSDIWGLLGLAALCSGLLFVTEFATIWIQDPVVLYRSYLWAIMMPVVVIVPLLYISSRILYVVGGTCLCFLAFVSLDRIHSLQDARSAWADASTKVDFQAKPNAIGRWRAYLNLGTEEMERSNHEAAYKAFAQASALGEPFGSARFNMGVALQSANNHAGALAEFAKAQSMGFAEAALDQQRAESLFAMGRYAEAFAGYTAALAKPQEPMAEDYSRLRRAEAAVATNNFEAALQDYQTLRQKDPGNVRYQVGLSMVYIGKQDPRAAVELLDQVIAKKPTAQGYYARALAHYSARDLPAAIKDLAVALRADPNNPVYRSLQAKLPANTPTSTATR